MRIDDPPQRRRAVRAATSPLAFAVGAVAAAAAQARELPARLLDLPATSQRLARVKAGHLRTRYEELAERGQRLLHGPDLGDPGGSGLPIEPDTVADPGSPSVIRDPPRIVTAPAVLPDPAADVPAASPPVVGQPGPDRLPAGMTAGAVVAHDELPLADFDHLTLPQLRGRIRRLDLAELVQLRDYEHTHADRLPVLTILDNRITALSG